MKNFIKYISLACASIFALSACNDDEDIIKLDPSTFVAPKVETPASSTIELLEENAALKSEVEALKKEKAKGEINDWKNAFVQKGDKQLLVKRTSLDAGSVKDIVFQLKKEIPNSVTIVISDAGEKPMITVGVSADLENTYHAGNIVKELAKEIQGGGGGNPGFATAGGKNLAGIENALNKAMEI